MREYALHLARSRLAYGRLTWLVRIVKNWRTRRDARVLLRMDDHQLRDIGLTRADLDRLMRTPLSDDLRWDDERRRLIESR